MSATGDDGYAGGDAGMTSCFPSGNTAGELDRPRSIEFLPVPNRSSGGVVMAAAAALAQGALVFLLPPRCSGILSAAVAELAEVLFRRWFSSVMSDLRRACTMVASSPEGQSLTSPWPGPQRRRCVGRTRESEARKQSPTGARSWSSPSCALRSHHATNPRLELSIGFQTAASTS